MHSITNEAVSNSGAAASSPQQLARRVEPAAVSPRVGQVEALPAVVRIVRGKRVFDVLVALTALLVLLPVMLIVALAVKASSRGPVLFRHERIGRHGKPFTCLKFRTMVHGADRMLQHVLAADPELRAEFARDFKLRADPRVTRLGAWLRRTSMDELPQFLNVLRGDMSIVGPRPVVEAELPRYGAAKHVLLGVRPGITGAWQVSGRNDVDYAQRVALDVTYVNEQSLWGDVAIILGTAKTLLFVGRNGAY